MPKFEQPPKPSYQLLIEGCLTLVLALVVLALVVAIAIHLYNSWRHP